MSKYVLTCGCGKNVTVEIGQAGGKVVCLACNTQLDVPTLRKLRHLPQVESQAQAVASTWGARQGIATAGLIFAGILAVVALGSRLFEPEVPVFDPVVRIQNVDDALKNLTPAQGFQMWTELYRPLAEHGFANIQDPRKPIIEQYIARQRFFQNGLWILAALSTAVAIAALLWPRPAVRR